MVVSCPTWVLETIPGPLDDHQCSSLLSRLASPPPNFFGEFCCCCVFQFHFYTFLGLGLNSFFMLHKYKDFYVTYVCAFNFNAFFNV